MSHIQCIYIIDPGQKYRLTFYMKVSTFAFVQSCLRNPVKTVELIMGLQVHAQCKYISFICLQSIEGSKILFLQGFQNLASRIQTVSWRKKCSLLWLGDARLLVSSPPFFFNQNFLFRQYSPACQLSCPTLFPCKEEGKGLNMIITEKANLCSLPCSSLCMVFLGAKEITLNLPLLFSLGCYEAVHVYELL